MNQFLKRITNRISNFGKGTLKVIARLFGVEEDHRENRYNSYGLQSAIWIFAIGTPIGMLLFGGASFSMSIWLGIVFGTLAVVNLDETLVLAGRFLRFGVYPQEERIVTLKVA